ncbi:DUF4397 domain-containing protein [Mucilaginibacter paludis]|uniref:DUF4397 domain-containing protein n=1 Tax=Mucilaginibacter paludis DSM 18603 TaxID=714943 RepID=H1Y708_9SPHI|nr:DUF4397 domain-containing protein [Mucilaginibacter paludis]EHQ28415.1 hypothetical protein Mucpa_4325 [Mucilaginibacter paludis DSM 18603]
MNIKPWSYLLAASFAVGSILSCNKNNSDLVEIPATPGKVAFYNLIPNSSAINMYVNGTRQNSNRIDYEYSSGYMSIAQGQQLISFKYDDTRNDVFTPGVNINIPAGNTTIFVAGKSASDLIYSRDTAVVDTLSYKPKFRFINASSDSPAYDVSINKVSITKQAYKSVSAFNRVDTGKVTLKVNVSGTSTSLLSTQITLQASTIYTMYLYGSYKGSGLTYNLRVN